MKNKIIPLFLTTILVVILDQFFKNYVLNFIGFDSSKEIIKGIINFTVVQNTGGAFSIFKEHPNYFKIIGLINVFLFSYLAFCPTVRFHFLMKIGCALVLGGTIGNLIDRFFKGAVTDFIDLQFINFAIFNLADVFIDVGVGLILIGWFNQKSEIRSQKSDNE